ncbi:recombinase family protein [Carnobacterium divergens]
MEYIYGYARVSTKSQELNRQMDLIQEKYKCNKIFTEKMSGKKSSRPELDKLKELVRENDTIVVESWSRLGRSTKDLFELMDFFKEKKVRIVSLKENFDSSTPQGRLAIGLFQLVNEFEVDLTRQRVNEGLASARSRGRSGGRPKVDQEKLQKALNLYDTKGFTLKEIKEMTGISSRTLYRYLEKRTLGNKKTK